MNIYIENRSSSCVLMISADDYPYFENHKLWIQQGNVLIFKKDRDKLIKTIL